MEFVDTFLTLASPATVIGAAVFTYDKKKIVHPVNVHSVLVIITWLAELAALWMSFLMASNLYEHTLMADDDSSIAMNKWFYMLRAIFVTLVVVLNLVGGISMGSAKFIQNTFCIGTYHTEDDKKGYKGDGLKYLYFALELIFNLLPLVGTLMINDRISKYDGVCTAEGKLDWDIALENKDYNLGQYYGWMLTFYGIAMGIRILRSLLFGMIYGAEHNNIVSHPSFTDAKSMNEVENKLRRINENMKMENDILKNARYEVTYNFTAEKKQVASSTIYRHDLDF